MPAARSPRTTAVAAEHRDDPFDRALGGQRAGARRDGDSAGRPRGPVILKMLELSTAHITAHDATALSVKANYPDDTDGPLPRVIAHEYGWLMAVPARDNEDLTDGELAREYPSVHAAVTYARRAGCQWVYFDRDAEEDENLPAYTW